MKYVFGNPYTNESRYSNQISRDFKKLMRELNLNSNYTTHSLRHGWAVNQIRNDSNIYTISKFRYENARTILKKANIDIINLDINELTGLSSAFNNKQYTGSQFINLMDSTFNQKWHGNMLKEYGKAEAKLQKVLSGKKFYQFARGLLVGRKSSDADPEPTNPRP